MANRSAGWKWIRKGALAIADQGMMSGSNFLLSVLLARWLGPRQYGAYALGLSIFYLIAAVHQALVLEPMSVLGTSEYSARQREYGGAILWFQGGFSAVLLLMCGAAGSIASWRGDAILASALYGLSIGGPGILLFWMARQACYVRCAPATAASGSGSYGILLLAGAAILAWTRLISAQIALVFMGAVGCVVGIALLVRIRPNLEYSRPLLKDVARRHWTYGRWALGSSVVIWVPANIFYSITTAILGIGSAGTFRALMNLIFPVTHTCSALSLLAQPQLSRTAKESGPAATVRPVMRLMTLYGTGALAWLTLIFFGHEWLWRLLYQGRFPGSSYLAIWLSVGLMFQVAAYAPAIGLRALQAPSRIFLAYSIAALTCIAAGIPATRILGLKGAVLSYSTALLLSFIATNLLFRREIRTSESKPIAILREPALSAGVQ